MNPDLQFPRHLAAPAVVPRDAVGVSRLNRTEQIRAEHIAAVVRFAKPFELAVGEGYRLQFGEENPTKTIVEKRTFRVHDDRLRERREAKQPPTDSRGNAQQDCDDHPHLHSTHALNQPLRNGTQRNGLYVDALQMSCGNAVPVVGVQ